jgi:Flp pilus assembly protein TadG
MSGSRRGTAAVEYAIVLPAFLMFLFGLIDCGRLIWTYATLSRAVEAAARCAVLSCNTDIPTYAAGQAWGLGLTSSCCTVTTPACGKQVSATLTFTFVIPWFYGTSPYGSANSLTVTTSACYPA